MCNGVSPTRLPLYSPERSVSIFYDTAHSFEVAWLQELLARACGDVATIFFSSDRLPSITLLSAANTTLVLVTRMHSSLYAAWPADLRAKTVLVHLSDESRSNHAALREQYLFWRHSFRNYWSDDSMHTFEGLEAAGRMTWFPLGYSHQFQEATRACAREDFKESYFMSFWGNSGTNPRRGTHVSEVEAALNISLVSNIGSGGFGTALGKSCEYVRSLQQSSFCLNLPGASSECFRYYDAVEAGCIPVLVDVFADANYTVANHAEFQPLLRLAGEPAPFVWVKSPAELRPLLSKDVAAITDMRRAVADWWQLAKRRTARRMRSILCPVRDRNALEFV